MDETNVHFKEFIDSTDFSDAEIKENQIEELKKDFKKRQYFDACEHWYKYCQFTKLKNCT